MRVCVCVCVCLCVCVCERERERESGVYVCERELKDHLKQNWEFFFTYMHTYVHMYILSLLFPSLLPCFSYLSCQRIQNSYSRVFSKSGVVWVHICICDDQIPVK